MRLLSAVTAALTTGVAAGPAPAAAPTVPFRVIAQDDGAARSSREATTRVVRDAGVWREVWSDLRGGAPSGRPRVDFARHMLVLVAAGERPTGGYAIRVSSVVRRDGRLVVRAQERTPGTGCITTQVLTAPYQVIRVARSSRRVSTSRRRVAVDC